MVATCFLLGIVRTFQGFIYDIYFSNSLYKRSTLYIAFDPFLNRTRSLLIDFFNTSSPLIVFSPVVSKDSDT